MIFGHAIKDMRIFGDKTIEDLSPQCNGKNKRYQTYSSKLLVEKLKHY